jgi:hypothetical protein
MVQARDGVGVTPKILHKKVMMGNYVLDGDCSCVFKGTTSAEGKVSIVVRRDKGVHEVLKFFVVAKTL